jgi:hypothetical protein
MRDTLHHRGIEHLLWAMASMIRPQIDTKSAGQCPTGLSAASPYPQVLAAFDRRDPML